jgi:hypothetical protein
MGVAKKNCAGIPRQSKRLLAARVTGCNCSRPQIWRTVDLAVARNFLHLDFLEVHGVNRLVQLTPPPPILHENDRNMTNRLELTESLRRGKVI